MRHRNRLYILVCLLLLLLTGCQPAGRANEPSAAGAGRSCSGLLTHYHRDRACKRSIAMVVRMRPDETGSAHGHWHTARGIRHA